MIVAPRPQFHWQLRSRSLSLGGRTLLMGVVNITPDSFSDGGQFANAEQAAEYSLGLLEQGADILDIGGESTRPGDRPAIGTQEEQERILPVMEAILRERPDVILSVDTYKAPTAHAAVKAGAEIVNDVSGFLWDDAMVGTCAALGCGVVLMHTRGRMSEWKSQPALAPDAVMPLVMEGLQERLTAAKAAGVSVERITLDPGFGFGKRGDENYVLLARLNALHKLGQPLVAGPSRKSFLGKTLEKIHGETRRAAERDQATTSAITATVLAGAHIVRVHNVAAARDTIAIADAIRQDELRS
jgi:dihydropteroate synthase